MSFCTAVNCMDGRTQLPVIEYMMRRFAAEYVDMVTEPGPVAILAVRTNSALVESILNRIEISVRKHRSQSIAIVAHHDCAGNPQPKHIQLEQLADAVAFIQQQYAQAIVIGLWVDESRHVNEM